MNEDDLGAMLLLEEGKVGLFVEFLPIIIHFFAQQQQVAVRTKDKIKKSFMIT